MKHFFLTFALILFSLPVLPERKQYPLVYAHRGCWISGQVPENSVTAVEMARRYGYPVVECDVHYTKDSVMVIMHDYNNMKRCIRKREGHAPIDSAMKTADITFDDLRKNYVLTCKNPKNRAPVPTLEELLTACRENGIIPMLHSNILESFRMAQRMFGNDWIAFGASDSVFLETRRFSDCTIMLSRSYIPADSVIRAMQKIGGRLAFSSMKYETYTKGFCDSIRQAGFGLEASIFPTRPEAQAVVDGASILLSNRAYMPNPTMKPRSSVKVGKHRFIIGEGTIVEAPDTTEYGASVMQITYRGTLSLIFNEKDTCTLRRGDWGTDTYGVRHFKKRPKVEILSMENSEIKSGKLYLYEF
ncbi:MAG: hypothetical protein K5945_02770 [Bacteroidaceae bacterium]|nr:hypothetical protein [Bacteroidaceae bacterium]